MGGAWNDGSCSKETWASRFPGDPHRGDGRRADSPRRRGRVPAWGADPRGRDGLARRVLMAAALAQPWVSPAAARPGVPERGVRHPVPRGVDGEPPPTGRAVASQVRLRRAREGSPPPNAGMARPGDTWLRGRFLEERAGRRAVAALKGAFAHHDVDDAWRALAASMSLFHWLATETTARLGLSYPNEADAAATALVATLQSEASVPHLSPERSPGSTASTSPGLRSPRPRPGRCPRGSFRNGGRRSRPL